ncbi:PaaX family transcriptional regulator C-terminal domain-containing protein [Pontiellaceae bacterium B12219]|nr:PaaX family transcriptional regulator C-terminal domain-containing protein [Pontiellaceae bacterium B12219]
MNWQSFHHPDISWPVVKRRAATEMLEMLQLGSLFMTRGGWAMMNRSCYPNQKAFRDAMYRLRNQGLVIHRKQGDPSTPELCLSNAGKDALPDYFHPKDFWNRKWNSIWYMFIYDVPEVDRVYRNVLRRFLKRMRLGCLQQSVWITPFDIRPQFDDLTQAASVDAFAYLFEARTVLGLPNRRVVEDAWDFDRLEELQSRYCTVVEENIDRFRSGSFDHDDCSELARMAVDAYHSAFCEDPLLPRALWPAGYLGERVYELHMKLFREVGARFSAT